MPTYAFKCRACGASEYVKSSIHEAPAPPFCSHGEMLRDYKAEGARVNGLANLARQRDPDYDPRLFLPTKSDFEKEAAREGAKNPEIAAEKKMDNWLETHQPAEGNKKPIDIRKL